MSLKNSSAGIISASSPETNFPSAAQTRVDASNAPMNPSSPRASVYVRGYASSLHPSHETPKHSIRIRFKPCRAKRPHILPIPLRKAAIIVRLPNGKVCAEHQPPMSDATRKHWLSNFFLWTSDLKNSQASICTTAPSSVERADLSSALYCRRTAKSYAGIPHSGLWLNALNFN